MPDEWSTEPLTYAEITDSTYGQRTATTFSARHHGAVVLLSGPCPRCEHATTSALVDEIYRREPAPASVDPGYRTLVCECTADHPRRPAGMVGCGAYWTLVVEEAA